MLLITSFHVMSSDAAHHELLCDVTFVSVCRNTYRGYVGTTFTKFTWTDKRTDEQTVIRKPKTASIVGMGSKHSMQTVTGYMADTVCDCDLGHTS